jgi:hypothetical protein
MRYLARFKTRLLNPTQEQIFDRDPVSFFSFYLSGRVSVLSALADEIIENLERGFSAPRTNFESVARAESLMWLWLLGTYEVVRTMHQAKQCFSERVEGDLGSLKKLLAIVRMPAAKMEKAGRRSPVTSNRSPSGLDASNRDLLVNDPEDNKDVSARFLLAEFDRVFCKITRSDILATHEQSYEEGLN